MLHAAPHQYDQHSDTDLVDLYRANRDLEVLGVLYNRYMYLIYGVCVKYLKNREDSQDAVMQIFEVLVNEIPRFDIRNFRSWLYGVTRNHCLMKLRKDHAYRNRFEGISGEIFMESTSVLHPVEEQNGEDLQAKLRDCIEQLKEEQRLCVELFYYQQHCYKQIAAELNYDEVKVKSCIQNGKRNLKICLESKAEFKHVGN